MLQNTAILIFTFLLASASAQSGDFFDDNSSYTSEPETHIVKRGETLFGISRKYGIEVAELKRMNGIRYSLIKVGQELIVDSGNGSNRRMAQRSGDGPQLSEGDMTVNGPRTYYKVQPGDNIYSIASDFGVLVDELREWNGISQVRVGQTLVVGKDHVARIPSYRPAPAYGSQEDNRSELSQGRSYRVSDNRTRRSSYSSTSDNDDRYDDRYRTANRNNDRWDDRDREYSSSASRRTSSSYRESYRDREPEVIIEDPIVPRRRNARTYPAREYFSNQDNDDLTSDSYRRYNNNGRNSNSSSRDSRYEDDYDEYSNRRFSNRNSSDYSSRNRDRNNTPSARDIKYGDEFENLYEYYDNRDRRNTSSQKSSGNINRRVSQPRMKQSEAITGDFTEVTSPRARQNRFYAMSNKLPVGTKVKMQIPENAGYVEVEIIDKLPSYERVMIGLSPACTAILEGAGNPHSVTIVAE